MEPVPHTGSRPGHEPARNAGGRRPEKHRPLQRCAPRDFANASLGRARRRFRASRSKGWCLDRDFANLMACRRLIGALSAPYRRHTGEHRTRSGFCPGWRRNTTIAGVAEQRTCDTGTRSLNWASLGPEGVGLQKVNFPPVNLAIAVRRNYGRTSAETDGSGISNVKNLV